MSAARVIGLILIAIGLVALSYDRLPYKHEEKNLQLGPVNVTKEKEKSVPLYPIYGIVAVIVGTGLLIWRGPKK